jgi:hypothetical protein
MSVAKTEPSHYFYNGAGIGLESMKTRAENTTKDESEKKSERGLLVDIFIGCHKQFERFFMGLQGNAVFHTATTKTEIDSKGISTRKRHSFGVSLRSGCKIGKDVSGYVVFGTSVAKYKIRNSENKANPLKPSWFVGFGLEKSIGDMFVRGEIDRVLKRGIAKVGNAKISADSYEIRFGGGYKF